MDKTKCKLYVPMGTSALYAAANGWKDFTTIIEEGVTAVNEINSTSVSVYVDQMTLIVKGAKTGETITVFTLSGVPLKTLKATDEVRILVPSRQLYVVRVGSDTYKVGL